jgi:hypothetical protein
MPGFARAGAVKRGKVPTVLQHGCMTIRAFTVFGLLACALFHSSATEPEGLLFWDCKSPAVIAAAMVPTTDIGIHNRSHPHTHGAGTARKKRTGASATGVENTISPAGEAVTLAKNCQPVVRAGRTWIA